LNVKEPITISITGGTDVKWAPSWDYFRYVFLPLLKKMGISVKTQLIKRGYYPKGGGEAEITISPNNGLKPLSLNEEQIFESVNGIVNISNLPDHIMTRMKHTAIKTLLKKDLQASISIDKVESASPGTGITLWSQSKETILGSTFLGERGMPSEIIGENAAKELIREIEAGSTIDLYAFDQLLPYMVLAKDKGSSSCSVSKISNHAQTNMWLLKQFIDVDIKLNQIDENILVNVGEKI
jgi:RNA 3'-phosphate cyclase